MTVDERKRLSDYLKNSSPNADTVLEALSVWYSRSRVPMNIKTVAVIGAGPMGRRLAALFAAAGFDTVLEDILPSNLRKASEYLSGVDCPDSVGPGNSNCVPLPPASRMPCGRPT